MISGVLLSWALLLLSISPLLAHPVSDPADMPYTGPDSMEEAGAEELSVSDVGSLLQRAAALGYSPLLSREGLKLNGLLPKEASKMVVLENPGHLTSLGQLLGIKRQYRKRANGADCFWKYCV
ncbi:urotensin 2, alpha [Astyanax mexicanus]|uniref:Prepro-urotensin II-alpha-like n=2 Tax=Astyanax mexicanus TaxID=7994 RepID=A0A8B9KDJ7_ASTMX|nr:urotensin 2, alpha [Astyanax mexicanus]KAG9269710.1 prepro-urotensin II-alpha-like [Astyanax mexicanus]